MARVIEIPFDRDALIRDLTSVLRRHGQPSEAFVVFCDSSPTPSTNSSLQMVLNVHPTRMLEVVGWFELAKTSIFGALGDA